MEQQAVTGSAMDKIIPKNHIKKNKNRTRLHGRARDRSADLVSIA